MPGAKADFEPLLNLLGLQMRLHRQLLTLAEEQRQSIIKNALSELEAQVKRQLVLLKQISALEKKRLNTAAGLQLALNLSPRPLTFSDLIPYAPPAQQQSMQELLDEFAALISKLKEANATNRLLLQTNMELNDLMLNLLADNVDPLNNLYCEDGSKAGEGPAGPSLFDHQV